MRGRGAEQLFLFRVFFEITEHSFVFCLLFTVFDDETVEWFECHISPLSPSLYPVMHGLP